MDKFEEASRFVAKFPRKLDYSETEFFPNVRVFWSQFQNRSIYDDVSPDSWLIHEKIKSAFCKIGLSHLNGLIQFWAPVKTTSGRCLSTSDQPFVLENLESTFLQYRLFCLGCKYSFDVDLEEDQDSGAPATAFLTHLPVLLNLRVHQGNPSVLSSLEYELTASLFLPVFSSSPPQSFGSNISSCVGVVECSLQWSKGLHVIFNKLKTALERLGLTTFDIENCRPYKSICGLKYAANEIKDALEIVCESHCLNSGQVWISSNDTVRKHKFAVKFIDSCASSCDDDVLCAIVEYYDICDMLPLKFGEGITGKTLQTYEPHFCNDIDSLSDTGLLALLPPDTKCSCLVVCLRSIHTGDDADYAFEFLWPKTRNCLILLESLLLTMKRCLPSFKFASGAQLGDELLVLDVENSTGSGIGFLNILQGNRISPIPKALEEKRRLLDCISSSEVKYNGGIESVCAKFVRTKLSVLCGSQIDSNLKDFSSNQEHSASSKSVRYSSTDEVVINAEYGNQQTLLYLPITSAVVNIKVIIAEKYKLSPDSYKLQFLDFEDEWICLEDDQDWDSCTKSWRTAGTDTIRLQVLPIRSEE